MRKAVILTLVIILSLVFAIWIVDSVPQPLPALFIVALFVTGLLGVLWRRRILSWAGVVAAWAFYAPVLLALFQVSIGMALIYGGLIALIYGIWAPLLSSETTAWLVRGRISDLQPFQLVAPILIVLGLVIFVVSFVQIIRSKIRGAGLVTNGLYSLVRHPQYLGVNLLALGFVLYGLRPIDFIAWANLVFLHAILAEGEEGRLKEKFGQAYLEYRRLVPFMLPFVPHRLRRFFGGRLLKGWKKKAVLIAIYLLALAILIAVLWAAWVASGAMLMR
ncbi:MAG: methyltransferase [Candidatus Hadarchaeum sp.]